MSYLLEVQNSKNSIPLMLSISTDLPPILVHLNQLQVPTLQMTAKPFSHHHLLKKLQVPPSKQPTLLSKYVRVSADSLSQIN